tara:strand:- start:3936 stop:4514 length:579 start_codon:yes stop_codon:yes gene_type:complete
MRHVGLFWSDETENTPIIDWDSSHLDFEKMHLDIWKYTSGDLQTELESQYAIVSHPMATQWDYYGGPGFWGIISDRLKVFLEPYSKKCFDFCGIELNSQPYHVIRRIGVIDCLDKKRSGQYPNGRKIYYDPCVFLEDLLPNTSLFSIPESSSIFITDNLARKVLSMDFRGILILNAGGNQRTGENLIWDPDW